VEGGLDEALYTIYGERNYLKQEIVQWVKNLAGDKYSFITFEGDYL
jgi:hypothetical protein